MELKRAKEITTSPLMAAVTYHGTPVYIESVSDDSTASIHPLDQPWARQKVNLSNLVEEP